MKRAKKTVDVAAAEQDFQRRLEELRATRKPPEPVAIRDDFDVPGFCRHGIPVHCPHCK